MAPKRKTKQKGGKKYHFQNQHGEGFFGTVRDAIKKGFNFIKDNKLVSGIASLIPHPAAQGIAQGARLVGMGKGRKKGGVGVGKITI